MRAVGLFMDALPAAAPPRAARRAYAQPRGCCGTTVDTQADAAPRMRLSRGSQELEMPGCADEFLLCGPPLDIGRALGMISATARAGASMYDRLVRRMKTYRGAHFSGRPVADRGATTIHEFALGVPGGDHAQPFRRQKSLKTSGASRKVPEPEARRGRRRKVRARETRDSLLTGPLHMPAGGAGPYARSRRRRGVAKGLRERPSSPGCPAVAFGSILSPLAPLDSSQ